MQHTQFYDFRIVNVTLGAWLLISAFLWPHATAELINAALVGVAIIGVALLATRVPLFRFANTVLAAWLLVSAYVLPTEEWGTPANSGLVAISVFLISLVGIYRRTPGARST